MCMDSDARAHAHAHVKIVSLNLWVSFTLLCFSFSLSYFVHSTIKTLVEDLISCRQNLRAEPEALLSLKGQHIKIALHIEFLSCTSEVLFPSFLPRLNSSASVFA